MNSMLDFLLPIFYQIIQVNNTVPCIFNQTAGWHMLQNCGFGRDFIKASLLPWEWVTGGWFSFIVVSIFILMVYIKYHKAIYPILIGVVFLPISFFMFPEQFFTFAILFAFIAIGITIWFIFIKQTND
jgi:hypothetical protein